MASTQSAPFKRPAPKRSSAVEFMGGCVAGNFTFIHYHY